MCSRRGESWRRGIIPYPPLWSACSCSLSPVGVKGANVIRSCLLLNVWNSEGFMKCFDNEFSRPTSCSIMLKISCFSISIFWVYEAWWSSVYLWSGWFPSCLCWLVIPPSVCSGLCCLPRCFHVVPLCLSDSVHLFPIPVPPVLLSHVSVHFSQCLHRRPSVPVHLFCSTLWCFGWLLLWFMSK